MDNTIIIGNSKKDVIYYIDKKYFYELHSGRIEEYFMVEALLYNEKLLTDLIAKGFDSYEKKFDGYEKKIWDNGAVTFIRKGKKFYIPISENFIEYYQLYWINDGWDKKYITISNNHFNKEYVESFYEFSLEVEIQGLRIRDSIREFNKNTIQFSYPKDNEELKAKLIELFGEPKVHPQNEGDKYGRFAKDYFFLPKSQINKIIGVKKHRDIATIGQPDGEQFTGKTEEVILDLHNFDENTYKIFEEHGMLEIEE